MTASISVGKLPWAMAIVELPPERSVHRNSVGGWYSLARLPTDPLFYTSLTLDNIVVGSRYRVTRRSTGDELATGVAVSTSETISALPCYSNPMLVDITVRNASGSPAYRVFDTAAALSKAANNAYILQQLDE